MKRVTSFLFLSLFLSILSFACSKGENPALPTPTPKPIVDYMFPNEDVPLEQRFTKSGLPVPVVVDWQNANIVDDTTTVPVSNTNLDFTNDFRSFIQWQPGLKLVATVQGETFEFDLPFVSDPQRLEQLARDFKRKHMDDTPMARRTIYVKNQTQWKVSWVRSWWNQVNVVNLIAGDGKPKIKVFDGPGDWAVRYWTPDGVWECDVSINPTGKYSPIAEVIILHEIGHCLGFFHSPYRYSIMCQSDTATEPCVGLPSRVLLPLEIRALQILYRIP